MNSTTESYIGRSSPPSKVGPLPPIAVVIPAYRSEKHISEVLAGIPLFVSFIVVVNDCSPDHLADVVQSCTDQRIHLVSHETNQGVGAAALTGYCKAVELGAEIIVKMDSDDQMDPNYLIPLIAPILTSHADYTKGNRFLHAEELKSMPIIRRVGNAGLSFLTKAASGYWNIFDPTNGYTAIHASVLPLLDSNRLHRRFFFEISMLIQLGMADSVVQDVAIPARYRDQVSSLSEWKSLLEFPPRLLAGYLRRLLIKYFLRDFGICSMLLLFGICFSVFGFFFGLYHWYLSSITNTIASAGTVMIAVLPLVLGSELLIQSMIVDMQNIPTQPLHTGMILLEEIRRSLQR
jgi:dolichol-phosphate mannosyltransferase